MPNEDVWDRIADQVCDAGQVDWEHLRTLVESDEEREVLENFRLIAQVAEYHASKEAHRRGWGRLEISSKLGEGTFGEVFKAWEPVLQRDVALKLYKQPAQSESLDEMLREGRLLARVEHPNVVTVHGADEHDGRVGIWMQYVEGATLEQHLFKNGPLDEREAAEVGVVLCRALSAVHEQGVIHRDIKAQNVMRDGGGKVLLMDMGLGLDRQAREPQAAVGTPLYMAPEILRGRPASRASDFYALGVLLFHLVTGDFPVVGQSIKELKEAHAKGRSRTLSECGRDADPSFAAILDKALDPDPSRRFSSAEDFRARLQAFLAPKPRRSTAKMVALWAALLALLSWPAYQGYLDWLTSSRLAEAREYYEAGDPEEAIAMTQLALQVDPESALGYRQLSLYQAAAGRNEEALENSRRAFQRRNHASSIDRHRIAATYHVQRFQFHEALREYERVALLDPSDAETLRQISQVRDRLGDVAGATEVARRAVQIRPTSINQGFLALLTARQDPNLALAQIDRIRGSSEEPDPYLYWPEGVAYLLKRNFAQARQAFGQLALGGDAFASLARVPLAQCDLAQGRIASGIHTLEEAASHDRANDFQHSASLKAYLLARAHQAAGDPRSASVALARTSEVQDLPTSLRILRNSAVLYIELDERDAAQRLLDRLKSIEGRFPNRMATGFIAQVEGELERQSDPAAAEKFFRRARDSFEDVSLARSLASFRIARGEYRRAIQELRSLTARAGKIYQDDSAVLLVQGYLRLAECHFELGEAAEAAAALGDFFAFWADADPALPDMSRALRLRGQLGLEASPSR